MLVLKGDPKFQRRRGGSGIFLLREGKPQGLSGADGGVGQHGRAVQQNLPVEFGPLEQPVGHPQPLHGRLTDGLPVQLRRDGQMKLRHGPASFFKS